MPRRSPSGWAPFLAAAMVAAGIATLGAAPARAQDDNIAPPPPPPGDDAAAPEDVSPPQTEPPARPPDQQTFEQSLSPYGHWVDTPEYGRVWIPDEGTDWQPYTDGQWVDTDYGWTFASTVPWGDRKSTRLNSSHLVISYAVFCLKKKKIKQEVKGKGQQNS